ncbi:MAG: RadC family protein [Sphaerochaetaceae bacterium]
MKELPPEQRPRERMESLGPASLSDLDLLTLLLGSGTSAHPVSVVAQKVLTLLDSLAADEHICPKQMQKIEGVGPAKATLICAALEIGRRRLPAKRKQLLFPSDVFPFIRHYGTRQQEHFLSIALNGAQEVLSITVVSIGSVNHTLVHPREVFAPALQQRATAVIVAHNHPSGTLTPSKNDLEVTKRLVEVGNLLGIKILDHIIFSEEGFISMLEGDMF